MFEEVTPVMNDNGELTLIYSAYYQKALNTPPVFAAVHVNKNNVTNIDEIAGIPKGQMYSVDWRLKGNVIAFSGLLLTKLKGGFHTLVTGELDPAQLTISKLKETKLEDHLIVPGFYKEKFKKELIPYPCLLKNTFDHKDGSRTFVYENKSEGASVTYDYAVSTGGTSMDISYFANYVYVIKFSAANELLWVQIIGKEQGEGDTNFYSGSAAFMDDKENVHVIFYDEPKNKLPEPVKIPRVEWPGADKFGLAVVQVATNGKMTKQFITEKKETKYHFTPKHVVSFRPNEILFLSINRKGMTLNGNQSGVYNNSKWHMGIVRFQ